MTYSATTFTRRRLVAGSALMLGLSAAGLTLTPRVLAQEGQSYKAEDLAVTGPLTEKALGSEDAPVTIYEYASMSCPHCARFHNETFAQLKEEYVDTGKVRFVFREFPLNAPAYAAAMVARCAPGDRYFPVIDRYYETQDEWLRSSDLFGSLLEIAEEFGFNKTSFEACLNNQALFDGLNWLRDRGTKEFGITGTPTFFIGGEKKVGALSIDEMRESIDAKL